jgi:hypothetical protein
VQRITGTIAYATTASLAANSPTRNRTTAGIS